MKITRQGQFKPHPPAEHLAGISGVRELQGEDLEYDSRTKFQAQMHKQAFDEQVYQKNLQKQQNDLEESYYANQTYETTRMRGTLEDHHNLRKRHMEETTKDYNKLMAQMKKDREAQEKKNQTEYEQQQLDEVKRRGKKIDFCNKEKEYAERGESYNQYLNGLNNRTANEQEFAKNHFETVQGKLDT